MDVAIEKVDCPEWGGHIFIRSITADKRDEFEQEFQAEGAVGVRARLVAACMCDAEGKHLEVTPLQVKALGKKSSAVLDRLFGRCMVINGMRDEDVAVMEKNSLPAAESDCG